MEEDPSLGHSVHISALLQMVHKLSHLEKRRVERRAHKTENRQYFIPYDIWPSILVYGDTKISLEREYERTQKVLKLFGKQKVSGLGDSWVVGGGSWREQGERCQT